MKLLKHIVLCGLLLTAGLSGCDQGFEELNKNPNIPDSVDPDYLFANAVLRYHTNYEHGVLTEIWGLQVWNQAMADINGIASAGNEYFVGGDALNNSWQLLYADVLGNVSEAIRLVEDQPDQQNRLAIYRIFRAFVFQRITDLWGDVPYSEAHQAVGPDNPNFTPKYDTQRSIYLDLLQELKASSDLLDADGESLGAEDWYFQGDVNQWRRFAHALQLRIALRLSEVDAALAEEEVGAALAENEQMQSPDNAVRYPHNDAARSAFYQLDFTGQGMRHPSLYFIDMLKADDDPRIGIYAEPTPFSIIILGNPDYEGVPSFLLSSEIDPDDLNDFTTSLVGPHFLEIDRPGTALDYAEYCFLRAEAAWRGWGPGDATTWYESGVRAHMEQLGVQEDVIITYLEGAGAFDGSLARIITEKWKTFVYTDAIEAFNEYRRTGFPVLTNNAGEPIDVNQFPKRLTYPDSEISFNGEQLGALGIDPKDASLPVWWDVQ